MQPDDRRLRGKMDTQRLSCAAPQAWSRSRICSKPGCHAGPATAVCLCGLGRRLAACLLVCADQVWTRIQRVPSRAPACILLSPAQRTLYVANEVDVHEGLAAGHRRSLPHRSFGRPADAVRPPTAFAFRNPPAAHGPLPGWKAARRGRLRRRNLQPPSDCGGRQPWPSEQHF